MSPRADEVITISGENPDGSISATVIGFVMIAIGKAYPNSTMETAGMRGFRIKIPGGDRDNGPQPFTYDPDD